jgi:hypothetical protein
MPQDGVGHDHLFPFIAKGTWRGLLVEPLKDFFERLLEHYSSAAAGTEQKLQFANMCVAEVAGKRVMRRLASDAVDKDLVKSLGYDGSSSLLSDAQGLPPGMALSFASLSPDIQRQVGSAPAARLPRALSHVLPSGRFPVEAATRSGGLMLMRARFRVEKQRGADARVPRVFRSSRGWWRRRWSARRCTRS